MLSLVQVYVKSFIQGTYHERNNIVPGKKPLVISEVGKLPVSV